MVKKLGLSKIFLRWDYMSILPWKCRNNRKIELRKRTADIIISASDIILQDL